MRKVHSVIVDLKYVFMIPDVPIEICGNSAAIADKKECIHENSIRILRFPLVLI